MLEIVGVQFPIIPDRPGPSEPIQTAKATKGEKK